MQHKQVAAEEEQVSFPQASRVLASYASKLLHIPEGIVLVHIVHKQEQQTSQQGQAHVFEAVQHPRIGVVVSIHALQKFVEEKQVVVLNPIVAFVVGPITFALPGYSLLFKFEGRNGAIVYTSVDAIPTGSVNTSVVSLFTIPSKSRTLQRILLS